MMIDPWGSESLEKYEHVFDKFGLSRFPEEYSKKLNNYLFDRGLVIAHRDFDKVLARIVDKKPFINMTGIATSGKFHLGHKLDVDIFKFFKSLNAKNYFSIADIDGYTSRPKIKSMDEAKELAVDNLSHVLALGLSKKDVYVQSRKEPEYYTLTLEISKKITENMFKAVYGHLDVGKLAANLLQYADILHTQLKAYEGKMPSITGIGLDQDPHAKLCRDIAKRLPYDFEVPSFLYFRHQGGLKEGAKMSSSNPDTAIFLSDDLEEVKKKLKKAFSGGRDSLEEHRKLGGIPEKDRAYEILLFHHPKTKFVEGIYHDYKSGKLLSGELKEICLEWLLEFLRKHQAKAKKDEAVARKMVYG